MHRTLHGQARNAALQSPPASLHALRSCARGVFVVSSLLALSACTTVYETRAQQPPSPVYSSATAVSVYVQPQAVVSVFIEPPIYQPVPVFVGWAPPAMLVDVPPPLPFAGAFWVGGYWAWQGNWVWAAGRWAAPPQPGLVWVHPYYENRDSAVVFVTGHWNAAGAAFVVPAPSLSLTIAAALPGVVAGPRPMGPPGIFVPAPPGSRPGIIVPAPLGTPPAVVTGAPPLINAGMRITNNVQNTSVNSTVANSRVNNITNITNITNVSNVSNFTIVAPPGATASGRGFDGVAPAQAHLAAAQTAVVRAMAPVPQSAQPVAAFQAGRAALPLPPPQTVRPMMTTASLHPAPTAMVPAPASVQTSAAPAAVASARAAQQRHEMVQHEVDREHEKQKAENKVEREKQEREKQEREKAEREKMHRRSQDAER